MNAEVIFYVCGCNMRLCSAAWVLVRATGTAVEALEKMKQYDRSGSADKMHLLEVVFLLTCGRLGGCILL